MAFGRKPSEVLDRMWADQEAYIVELEAKVEKLEAENWDLLQQRFKQGERMTARTLQLALGGQLNVMSAETLRACGYDPPGDAAGAGNA